MIQGLANIIDRRNFLIKNTTKLCKNDVYLSFFFSLATPILSYRYL